MTLPEKTKAATEKVIKAIVSAAAEPDEVDIVTASKEYSAELFNEWNEYFLNLFK